MDNNSLALRVYDMLKTREGKKANILEKEKHRVMLRNLDEKVSKYRRDTGDLPFEKITNEALFDRTGGKEGTETIHLSIYKIQSINDEPVADINCISCKLNRVFRRSPHVPDHEINCITCNDLHYIISEHHELLSLGFEEVVDKNGTYYLLKSHRLEYDCYDFKVVRDVNVFDCSFYSENGKYGHMKIDDLILFIKTNPEIKN
jgi:hypothetical protein